MLLSAVDQHAAGAAFLHSGSADERGEMEVREKFYNLLLVCFSKCAEFQHLTGVFYKIHHHRM